MASIEYECRADVTLDRVRCLTHSEVDSLEVMRPSSKYGRLLSLGEIETSDSVDPCLFGSQSQSGNGLLNLCSKHDRTQAFNPLLNPRGIDAAGAASSNQLDDSDAIEN